MAINFYKTNEKFGEFSNFSRHGIELDGYWWPTTEHYFQAQKFEDTNYQEQIRNAPTPGRAAELGRSRKLPLRTDWDEMRDEVMFKAVLQKFQTHANLKTSLLSTGDEELVEKTSNDYYWGCGTKGTGKNKLGIILMQIRKLLRCPEAEKGMG